MDVREQLELAYMKDKHSSVRVLFQETSTVTRMREGRKPVFCAVMALYVMDLNILCVDAKVLMDNILPHELRGPEFAKRVLETHEFPSAVRRAIELADQLVKELTVPAKAALGENSVDV